MNSKIRAILFITIMLLTFFNINIKKLQARENENLKAVSYKIVSSKYNSFSTLENKKLSDYTTYELKKLPITKRMRYKIVVGKDIKKSQIRPTIEKIISDLTKKNPDIDEIHLLLYSTKDRVEGVSDIAIAIWSTGGNFGGMTREIVKNNIRKGYKISIEIKENLEEYLKLISKKPKTKMGFSESKKKTIFKELVHCEDRAQVISVKYYDPMCSKCREFREDNNYKLIQMEEKLENKYKEKVRIKYGITKEKQDKIYYEGCDKNWPLPKILPFSSCCD